MSERDQGIDEAFDFLSASVSAYTDLAGEVVDEEAGVRMSVEELYLETPVELDVHVAADGSVSLGCVPPLYPVELTVGPVLHRLSLLAVVTPRGARTVP